MEMDPLLFHAVQALYLGAFGLLALVGIYFLAVTLARWRIRSREPQAPTVGHPVPLVTVQVPLRNEFYVTDRVLDALGALRWPRDRLQVQVIDDSDDETTAVAAAGVRRLQENGVQAVLVRPRERSGSKAAALNAGLRSATGSLVAVFDADFVPPPDFLERTVPFLSDPEVACVQTRWSHLNESSSLLSRCLAFALDAHFAVEQRVRSEHGFLMSFNATACVWRRSVLEEAGGWPTDTLTEDLDLTLTALLAGRRFVYLDEPAAPAEVPAEILGFKKQQARWARGGMQNLRKHARTLVRADAVPPLVRVDGMVHLAHYAIHPLVLLLMVLHPFLLAGDLVARPVLAALAVGATLGPVLMLVTGQRVLHPRDWVRRLVWVVPMSLVGIGISLRVTGAVLAGLFGPRGTFERTPKYRLEATGGSWRDTMYAGRVDGWVLAEAGLGLFLAAVAVLAVMADRLVAVPGAVVGAVAFLGVAAMGLHAGRRRGRPGTPPRPVPPSRQDTVSRTADRP